MSESLKKSFCLATHIWELQCKFIFVYSETSHHTLEKIENEIQIITKDEYFLNERPR